MVWEEAGWREQYGKVATKDTDRLVRSNGESLFCCLESLLDIAGFCQDAELWDAQLCDFVPVSQPVIKLVACFAESICRTAGTRDADVTSCSWMPLRDGVPMKLLWNMWWYQLLYSATLLRILHYLWLDMLFAFGTLATVYLWVKNLATFFPAFCMCQYAAQVTFMVLMRRFRLLVCMRCDQALISLVLCFLCLLCRPLQISEYLHYLLCSSRRGAVVHMNWLRSVLIFFRCAFGLRG